jgi:hypothetical protein
VNWFVPFTVAVPVKDGATVLVGCLVTRNVVGEFFFTITDGRLVELAKTAMNFSAYSSATSKDPWRETVDTFSQSKGACVNVLLVDRKSVV